MTKQHYAPAVGNKFYPDGRVRLYPGNTVICFVDPDSVIYQHCAWIQGQLQTLPFVNKYSLLPMSSMHMTVFELITDAERGPEKWSGYLSVDTLLEDTDKFFIEKFATVNSSKNFRMTYRTLQNGHSGISIRLRPIDELTNTAIHTYREELANATGIRFPDHMTYEFHISLAYRILNLTDEENSALKMLFDEIDTYMMAHFGIFTTSVPQITFFDDMFAFLPAHQRHTLKSRAAQ